MTEPLAYLNGRFLPQGEARLALNDAGFVFGATVTDLVRTFAHRPFHLADHLRRFRQSCALAHIPQPRSDDDLTAIAERLVTHNAALLRPGQDLALVLFATPGPLGHYLGDPNDGPPTLGLHTFPLPFARYARLFREGARLVVPATRHVPATSIDPRVKQRSRLHWWLAEQEARQVEPGASALLLDADGYVTETAFANLLVVRGGAVQTPARAGVLGGVSLQVVEELCEKLGVPFAERPLRLDDCRAADEAMLSCTSFCLAGVSRLQSTPLAFPGPIFERLLRAWGDLAGLDVRAQILAGG
ncbi:MAG TPA: aminotransferase class IV [Gemmataceae bacterium]|jgi:branched-subunit amino acid aminotransferase/4-amino-4-deoxychorismate lyase|nr:aminotransferase class IV [Gemmataceae bacterium]